MVIISLIWHRGTNCLDNHVSQLCDAYCRLQPGAYHAHLRKDIDAVVCVFEPKWSEQFDNVLLCVAAIVVRRQFGYHHLLQSMLGILEKIKKRKKKGVNN